MDQSQVIKVVVRMRLALLLINNITARNIILTIRVSTAWVSL